MKPIELIELENRLVIKLTDKEEVLSIIDRNSNNNNLTNIDVSILFDMLDSAGYIGNDYHVAEFALTEILNICYGAIYDNDDSELPTNYESVWVYKDTYINAFWDELIDKGIVEFDLID